MTTKKRWVYLGLGTIILLFHGVIYAWSIFRQPLNALYPEWSVSQISLTFTISIIFFCLGAFFAGNLSKITSVKNILMLSAVILFIGFMGVSEIHRASTNTALLLLYTFYGILCGGGIGMGYNAVISCVNKWFPDRLGFASGIMMMGFGLGGIVLGSNINSLIAKSGLFITFKILAVMVVIILIFGAAILKVPTQSEMGQGLNRKGSQLKSYSTTQMLATKQFWLFIVWAVLLNSAGLIIINSAASISVAFGASAVLGLIISVCNGFGRVLIGYLFDKIYGKKTMAINIFFMFFAGVSLLSGALLNNISLIFLGIILTGIAYGGSPSVTSAFIYKEFGPKDYPVNFSLGTFALIPAAIIGPMLSSKLIEFSGGSYTGSFIVIIGLSILAAFAWLALYRGRSKK